jgi:hypothetical protein
MAEALQLFMHGDCTVACIQKKDAFNTTSENSRGAAMNLSSMLKDAAIFLGASALLGLLQGFHTCGEH